ncbi:MAG: hypothetical protein UV60_C0011G0025 [Parcubacteria group bacterium GW2011_GWA2_43_11]|nr:MAG: hypothetical protein UU89_C0045G0003 [Parcubacteria group bacterium GW2011_GWC2_42_11]KKS85125.1 MAG: hypothetical protein UV60_C0011G0025 [Parcubacteria group bacterium GW2011_GWA2_43_11]
MNNEGVPSQAEEQKAPVTERTQGTEEGYIGLKKKSYAEARQEIKKLYEVVPEAQEIIYRERPAKTSEEYIIGQYEMLIGSLESLKEKFAQQGEMHKERAMAMYIQKMQAEKTITALYLDAKTVNEDFASDIIEDSPFLKEVIEGVEVGEGGDLPQVEFVE